jgi:hypothetical protein
MWSAFYKGVVIKYVVPIVWVAVTLGVCALIVSRRDFEAYVLGSILLYGSIGLLTILTRARCSR